MSAVKLRTKLQIPESGLTKGGLSDDGKTLSITALVDDPAAFKQPWSGTTKFRREQKPMIEIACAENNEHFDFRIPVADKADF